MLSHRFPACHGTVVLLARYLPHRIIPFILFLPLLISIVFANKGSCAEKGRVPNIIIILADDLGYGDLSCYGATDVRTPNIDKLARSGIRFTRFYANSSVCSPDRKSVV